MTTAFPNRKLTVALLVRDEVEPLSVTLENVRQVADEIVVVDLGSHPQVAEVIQQHAAKRVPHVWNDSYSAARNAAHEAATGQSILWLEPGETLSESQGQQLREFVLEGISPNTAYVMLVSTPQSDGMIGSEQIGKIRLLPNLPTVRFEGRVAETVLPRLLASGVGLDALAHVIQRMEPDHQRKLNQAVIDVRLIDQEVKEAGPTARLMIHMAEAMQVMNDQGNALLFFQQACQLAEPETAEMLEGFYGILTSLDGQAHGIEIQIDTCMTALEMFPLDAQLLCAMGGYLQTKGHLELARRSFDTAYRYGQVNLETWHINDIDEIAASCLAITTSLSGLSDDAERIVEEALATFPNSLRLRRQMIDIHVKYGRRTEALAELEKLPESYPQRELLRSVIRGGSLAAQRKWSSARPYLEAAYQQGYRDAVCLRWYSATLLALGDTDTARTVLELWLEKEPLSDEPKKLLRSLLSPNQNSMTGNSRRVDSPGNILSKLSGAAVRNSVER